MKILHTADLHLDFPFAALSPEKAALRRREGREMLGRLAKLAAGERVDLVLLAGDLFDSHTIYRETLVELREVLASIPAPVLIAPGNHDPFTPRSAYATLPWPENVSIFSKEEITGLDFSELGCVVHGTAFRNENLTEDLWAGFQAPADGKIHIGLSHGDLGQSHSPYHPIGMESVERSGLDYLALGHIHTPSGLRKAGKTSWAYPGCPEGHGFDETGERGCLIVEVGKGEASARFYPLAKRRYLELDVPLTPDCSAVEEAEKRLCSCSPEDCVKLIFTGETGEQLNVKTLEIALGGRVFALRCRDHTKLRSGLWDREEEETLTGLFLRIMRRKVEDREEQAELAVRFGLAALEQGEDCRP